MRKLRLVLSLILLAGMLVACGNGDNEEEHEALSEEKITVGVTAGPHEEIAEYVAELAAEEGLEIEVMSFSDFILPNTALAEGDLDMVSYQHVPFLEQFNADNNTDLVAVAENILIPMSVYSETYESFDDLPDGATFGLPNDPTNGARALFILEQEGYITIEEGKGETASVHDIIDNPLNLEFIELDAAQIPIQLSEVDAAAINMNYVLETGMDPNSAILMESTDSPYTNLIVVRPENQNDPVVQTFIDTYHSQEVLDFIEEEFQGSVIASWEN